MLDLKAEKEKKIVCNIFRCPWEKLAFKKSISIAKLCHNMELQHKESGVKKPRSNTLETLLYFKNNILQYLSWKLIPKTCNGKE